MADRRPIVLISGIFSELPQGDNAVGASAGNLIAGSGVAGGGALDGSDRRLDIALAANASGLIIVGAGDSAALGLDGSAQASGNAALTDLANLNVGLGEDEVISLIVGLS